MEFEKLKKNYFPTDRPIPEKQGRVRGNKNIFKVGLTCTPRVGFLVQSHETTFSTAISGTTVAGIKHLMIFLFTVSTAIKNS